MVANNSLRIFMENLQDELITVIVPVYNALPWLEHCIDSLCSQSYNNLEIILVDDGSTDGSGSICDGFSQKDSRIKVIHKQNGGVSSARNEGLSKAKGGYIGFVDADDYIEPDMYGILLELIKNNNAQIAGCNISYAKDTAYCQKEGIVMVFTPQEAINKDLASGGLFICNKLFAKNVLTGLFFDKNITIGEDMLFCFNAMLKSSKIAYTDFKKYNYNRSNTNSATLKEFNINKLTYFEATAPLLTYALNTQNKHLYKLVSRARIYHVIGFLRQAAAVGYVEKNKEFATLLHELRSNILGYLFSEYKISNKCFGTILCLGYAFTSSIYRIYLRIFC